MIEIGPFCDLPFDACPLIPRELENNIFRQEVLANKPLTSSLELGQPTKDGKKLQFFTYNKVVHKMNSWQAILI